MYSSNGNLEVIHPAMWGGRLSVESPTPGRRMKTAVTVLQEMMVKLGQAPEYECIGSEGPAHQAQFTVSCRAAGVTVSATARSKKEAKQEAARRALDELAAGAVEAPPASASPAPPAPPAATPEPTRTHVALLAELCDHMGLLAPVYEEISAEGPPHSRVFTWSARVGGAARRAGARSKKQARQLAAAALYRHLRDNLPQHVQHFDEEAALARAHERAMERYSAAAPERAMSALALPIADYGAALSRSIDEPRRLAALAALETGEAENEEAALAACVEALGATCGALVLPPSVRVITLASHAPPLVVAAPPGQSATRAALRMLRRLLRHPAPPRAETDEPDADEPAPDNDKQAPDDHEPALDDDKQTPPDDDKKAPDDHDPTPDA